MQYPIVRGIVPRLSSKGIKEIEVLKPIIGEELIRHHASIALIDAYDRQLVKELLMYLYGFNNAKDRKFAELGVTYKPDWREQAQLRVACAVVAELGLEADTQRIQELSETLLESASELLPSLRD
jgi:hypothetical protein